MMNIRKCIKQVLILGLFSFFIFFSCSIKISAEELRWIEVDRTINGIQFIDANSIKYNNKGLLSVTTKYSEVDPEDQSILSTNSSLIAVDCENRLFSKLPVNGDINRVKTWQAPSNNKLIKKTIINSCSN